MQVHINKDTQLCMSLAGRPGNFGTRFHNFLYRELGLNFIYKAFTTRDIGSAIGGLRALGIRGCAISMPFKEACIQYLDELDASAKGIMSVNTIVNTDGYLMHITRIIRRSLRSFDRTEFRPVLILPFSAAVAWRRPLLVRSEMQDLPMV